MEKKIVEREVVRELSKRQNKKEALIQFMLEDCVKIGYNIEETREFIDEFYRNT